MNDSRDQPDARTPGAGAAGGPVGGAAGGPAPGGTPAPRTTAPPAAPDEPKRGGDAAARPNHGLNARGKVRTTRAGAWWTALVLAAVLSILILVFIVQNGESVAIRFLGFEGQLPLAVSLLAAAVAGALVVAIPGIFRILQLRRALARNAKEL